MSTPVEGAAESSWQVPLAAHQTSVEQLLAAQPRAVLEAILCRKLTAGQIHWHVDAMRKQLGLQKKLEVPVTSKLLRESKRKHVSGGGCWAAGIFSNEMQCLMRNAKSELSGTIFCLHLPETSIAALELLETCGPKHEYPFHSFEQGNHGVYFDVGDRSCRSVHEHPRYNRRDRPAVLTFCEETCDICIARLSLTEDGDGGPSVTFSDGHRSVAAFVHPALRQTHGACDDAKAPALWPKGAASLSDVCWHVDLLGERSLRKQAVAAAMGAQIAGTFLVVSADRAERADLPSAATPIATSSAASSATTVKLESSVRFLFYPPAIQCHLACWVCRAHGLSTDLVQRICGHLMQSVGLRIAPSTRSVRAPARSAPDVRIRLPQAALKQLYDMVRLHMYSGERDRWGCFWSMLSIALTPGPHGGPHGGSTTGRVRLELRHKEYSLLRADPLSMELIRAGVSWAYSEPALAEAAAEVAAPASALGGGSRAPPPAGGGGGKDTAGHSGGSGANCKLPTLEFASASARKGRIHTYNAADGGVLALLSRCASNGNGALSTRNGATIELFAATPGHPAALVLEVGVPTGGRMRAEAFELTDMPV